MLSYIYSFSGGRTAGLFLSVAILLALSSCAHTHISASKQRTPPLPSLRVNEDVKITHTGIINIAGTDFFPSSFRIEAKGKIIYIDPILLDDSIPADYILITHAHSDHFSLDDILKVSSLKTVVIGPHKVTEKLPGFNVLPIEPGDTLHLDGLSVEGVEAVNTESVFLWIKAHQRKAGNVGFVIDIDGIRIYHAGDTDISPAISSLENITVALLPIGNDNLTMGPDHAAVVVNSIRPAIVVPMHYVIKREHLDRFLSIVSDKVDVRLMRDED